MRVVPITMREANDFVENFHRHNGRTQRDGGRFAIAAEQEGEIVGIAIVGRPLARLMDDGFTAEVTRCCASPRAPRNTGSFLYGRCWRIWQQMGGQRLITYTLQSESGASLRGAGWRIAGKVDARKPGNAWTGLERGQQRDRAWDPIYGQLKLRWEAASAEP